MSPLIQALQSIIANHPGDIAPAAQHLMEMAMTAEAAKKIKGMSLCLCGGNHPVKPISSIWKLTLTTGHTVDRVDVHRCLICHKMHLYPWRDALACMDIGTPETIERLRQAVVENLGENV